VVQHASRRADDDLRAALEGLVLRPVADPPVHGDGLEALALGDRAVEPLELGQDLAGELAGGPQDDRLGLLNLGVQQLEQRQQEGSGLAGPGAGLHDQVLPTEDVGDGALLDRHQVRPAGAGEPALEGFRKRVHRGRGERLIGLLEARGQIGLALLVLGLAGEIYDGTEGHAAVTVGGER
jgi:hypothetical protein